MKLKSVIANKESENVEKEKKMKEAGLTIEKL